MIRRERRDGGEGEERGLRKGAERGYRVTRQKLQNSKVAKSPEFSPALGLIIFGKKSVATNLR